ncbi:hypothetical protein [Rhodococcoides yunnanense]|uniref:hypothetical protein n=1 Tax=Rhodococcoides yunnanense TaxID=278209 RepID=UPI0009345DFB|nr:hypothetical protein [Rhodococcus yunnanensis]
MTEPDSDPDRPRRSWVIPTRLFGRVRTSTVLIGVCFILTALLYDQVRPEPAAVVNGPTAVDTSQYQTGPQQQPEEQYTEPSTTVPTVTTTSPSGTQDPSSQEGTSGAPGSSTGGQEGSTTQDPTYLPGLTIPPQLRSLLPAPPSATGTP